MQAVLQLVIEGEWKEALVRLWHLGHQPSPAGGNQFDGWAGMTVQELPRKRIQRFFGKGKALPTLQDLEACPTEVIRQLDEALSGFGKKPRHPTPICIDGTSYHIVPCREHAGFEQNQPPRFCNHMRHHRIFPATLTTPHPAKVDVKVFDSAGLGRLHQTLKELAEQESASLKIGLGHFADQQTLAGTHRPVGEQRTYTFFTHTSDEAARRASAFEQIAAAETAGVHLLVFPELTLSPANQQAIERHLLDRSRQYRPCRIPLIVLGSFHRQGEEKRNQARLLWGGDGRRILEHNKYSPASLDNVTEDFLPGNHAAFLCTPIGNFSLAICKDIFDDFAGLWIDHLAPEWLLVPSLSNSLSQHLATTKKLWNRHRCTSIVANQRIDENAPKAPPSAKTPHFGYIQAGNTPHVRSEASSWQQAIQIPPLPPQTKK